MKKRERDKKRQEILSALNRTRVELQLLILDIEKNNLTVNGAFNRLSSIITDLNELNAGLPFDEPSFH